MEGAARRFVAEPAVLAGRCQAKVPQQVDSQIACESCPLKDENAELRQERGYYKAMHRRACERERELKRKVEELEAKLRLRERQLFSRKSEKCGAGGKPLSGQIASEQPKRPRGQQPGSQGHGRRDYSHLPAADEVHDVPEQDRQCPRCGCPFEGFDETEDSEQLEVEVQAHRRVIRRKQYKCTCSCGALPGIVTAPPPPKLIPRGIYGISIWVAVLLDKYCFLRPTHRLLEDLKTHGLDLSPGTVTDGLKCLVPLFEPILEGIKAKNLEEKQWHGDETRWTVFVAVEGKVGFKWYLWVFDSASAVVYVLDPSRAARVPEEYFEGVEGGTLIVDRYSAYKAMYQVKDGRIVLAFCWTHVRRDFLSVAKDWPTEEPWGLEWVERIGTLIHLNKKRLEVRSEPAAFAQRDTEVREAVDQMAQQRDEELGQSHLHPARRKALESLRNHWEGLILFVDHPEIPMTNDEAERQMRPPAVARKVFYGSGSLWSGQLAAMLFSIFATLRRWKLNARKWLTAYLQACAENGGKAPPDATVFLPWNLSERRRQEFAEQPAVHDSS